MDTIRKATYFKKEIIIVEFHDRKEAEMIELLFALESFIKSENKKVLLLHIFNDKSYITSAFLRQAEKLTQEIDHLIEKRTMTGYNRVKKMILNGYNLLLRKNIQAFDTLDEAIIFLTDDNTTDKLVK